MPARTNERFDPERVAPWSGGTGSHGVLLIHGFTSTPKEMKGLAAALVRAGFRCAVPALPGHATTPEELAQTRWQDWASSVLDAVDALSHECDKVSIVGQSMGGSLALFAAAYRPSVESIAALATPMKLPNPILTFIPVLKYIIRWHVPSTDIDLFDKDAVAELDSYGRWPTASIHELVKLLAEVRILLPTIRQPVLLAHGGGDRMVRPADAALLSRRLVGAQETAVVKFQKSGHGLTVDIDKDAVATAVADWFHRHEVPAETAGHAGPAAVSRA